MPIYEYECRKCKAHTEVFQKINDKPRTRCPKCKGRLDKLTSASAVHFKGSGWYVTDYASRDKGSKSEASEEKASVSSESTPSTEKTKTKDTKTSRKSTADSGATSKPSSSS